MNKYVILLISVIFASVTYAQKSEIKAMKKILDKKNQTQADYKELQSLIDASMPYIGNAKAEEQAEFYSTKALFEYTMFKKTNDVEFFSNFVESINRMASVEQNEKRKKFTKDFYDDPAKFASFRVEAFSLAIKFNRSKEYRNAGIIFKGLYDLNKEDLLSLYHAASMAINVEDYNTALEYYQELLDLNFTGEGVYYTAVNNKTGEVENFGESKNLMLQSVKMGEYSNPKEEKEPSKRPDILKNMVFIYTSVNQKAKAEQFLEEARKENPDDFDLMMIQASFLMQNKEIDKFEALMKETLIKYPQNPELYFNLGVVCAEALRIDEAKKYYEKTLQLDPKFVNAHINLGVIELREEAEIVEKMTAITGYSDAENRKYEQLKKQRESLLKKAIPYFEKALSIEPNNPIVIENLAEIYGILNMLDKQAEYKAMLKD